jgi:hypothetical protein
LTDYEKVPYWLSMPIGDFSDWIEDVIELAEDRKKAAKRGKQS